MRKNIVLLLVFIHQGHLATLSFFPCSFLWWIFNKMTSNWKLKLNGKERMLSGKILNSLLDYLIGGNLFLLQLGTLYSSFSLTILIDEKRKVAMVIQLSHTTLQQVVYGNLQVLSFDWLCCCWKSSLVFTPSVLSHFISNQFSCLSLE